MKRYLLLYIGWLVVGLLASCTGRDDRAALRRAEVLMETDAVAASAALDSITPTTLRGEARARYALLRTQADYKNFVPLTSDSLILIATRHYGTRRQTLPAALAQYYLGCTYKDMGRDLDAIDALLRATTLFPDDTNRYLPYTYAELGNLYLSHNMPDEAIQVLRRYKEYGIAHNDEEIIGQADYFMGRGYLYSQLNDSAYESFHRVISNHASSKQYIDASHFQLSKLCLYQYHDSLRATQYINQYINANADFEDMGAAYLIKAELSSGLSEVDSALCYYQLAISKRSNLNARCWAYKGLSRLAPLVNKTDSVGYYSDMFANLLDSVYLVNHRSEINELITNHTIELHDREMAERHNRLLWMLGLSALVLVAGSTISLLMVKKRQQADKLAYQEELASLRREQISQSVQEDEPMDNADPSITDADCEAAPNDTATVQPRFDYFRKSVEAYRIQFGKSEWAVLLKDNKADILLKNKLSADKGAAMMTYITDLFSDLFIHLLNENPALSRLDLEYCAMAMLRLKTDQMAYCTQATVHSYHCRHGKVRDKLTDDWYALIFGKPKNT